MTGTGHRWGSDIMTQDASKKQPATGYKIYVRVPWNEQNISAEEVTKWLQDFAQLMTDLDKHITVEVYSEKHEKLDKLELKALHAGVTGQEIEEAKVAGTDGNPPPYGGPWSPLIPMYVCHNKN
jgi:hypothetical protein